MPGGRRQRHASKARQASSELSSWSLARGSLATGTDACRDERVTPECISAVLRCRGRRTTTAKITSAWPLVAALAQEEEAPLPFAARDVFAVCRLAGLTGAVSGGARSLFLADVAGCAVRRASGHALSAAFRARAELLAARVLAAALHALVVDRATTTALLALLAPCAILLGGGLHGRLPRGLSDDRRRSRDGGRWGIGGRASVGGTARCVRRPVCGDLCHRRLSASQSGC